MKTNLYQVLGLNPDCSQEEIKAAYRKYAAKIHPDKHDGDKFFEEQFKQIQNAYETLKDYHLRKEYDDQPDPDTPILQQFMFLCRGTELEGQFSSMKEFVIKSTKAIEEAHKRHREATEMFERSENNLKEINNVHYEYSDKIERLEDKLKTEKVLKGILESKIKKLENELEAIKKKPSGFFDFLMNLKDE